MQKEKKLGEPGYVNKNCWLARNVNGPPTKRCQYCEIRFQNCMFSRYLLVSLVLVLILLGLSYAMERNISKPVIVSIFLLIIVYGYFFDKSTEKIIEASFAQKQAKDALEDLTKNLQKKVDEQTKELRQAYQVEKQAHEELEKLSEAKTQFILATQHHLRTPLSATSGYLDLLLGGNCGKISKKVLEVVKRAMDSTQREIGVVNDLLNISQFQLGRGAVMLKPGVLVKNILEEILQDLQPVADKKNIYLKFEPQGEIPEITADQNQIKMALTNIVDNAVKYTKEGGVTVELGADSNIVKIKIKDTGMGMTDENKKALFNNAFQRSKEAWTENATGKGIGLYLSAKIIEAHNGKIAADSQGPGKGSEFSIELPILPQK